MADIKTTLATKIYQLPPPEQTYSIPIIKEILNIDAFFDELENKIIVLMSDEQKKEMEKKLLNLLNSSFDLGFVDCRTKSINIVNEQEFIEKGFRKF